MHDKTLPPGAGDHQRGIIATERERRRERQNPFKKVAAAAAVAAGTDARVNSSSKPRRGEREEGEGAFHI